MNTKSFIKIEKFKKALNKFNLIKHFPFTIIDNFLNIKLAKKIDLSEKTISEAVRNLFINQTKIDDVVEKHKAFNLEILSSHRKFKEISPII